MNSIHQRLVVVTGASNGLGKSIASTLAQDGYRVVGLSRSGTGPDGVEARICDVGDHAEVARVLADVERDAALFGLVNCAGVASMNLVVSTPPQTAARIVNTNLLGTIYCCMALSKRFIRNKSGRIINFSTIAVPLALKGEAVYVASKAGVEGFSRSFAREMADFGVYVNVIAPGPIDTALIAGVSQSAIDRIVERQILPHKFSPTAVTDLVRYLFSDAANMLSGQVLAVGGA